MITTIIPTYNQIKYTDQLLNNILENEIHPREIILIDDCSTEDVKSLIGKYKKLKIKYIRHSSNKGVNYSWNEGMKSAKTPIVTILNNDIIINKFFFKKIIDAYNTNDSWGIICPRTLSKPKNIKTSKDEPIILHNMKKREGWAWSARMEFIKKIKPIPDFLRTYCGDDYLFFCAKKLGYSTLKMMNNFIYHYGGKTVSVTKACSGERQKEKKLWLPYKQKLSF